LTGLNIGKKYPAAREADNEPAGRPPEVAA
jgi:hypothetical protein